MPADTYQLAYDAIEEFVARHHQDESEAWLEVIPAVLWGYTANGWEAAASEIVANFNRRLPPESQIEVERRVKRKTASTPLIDFQRLLAALADAASSATIATTMIEALGL